MKEKKFSKIHGVKDVEDKNNQLIMPFSVARNQMGYWG